MPYATMPYRTATRPAMELSPGFSRSGFCRDRERSSGVLRGHHPGARIHHHPFGAVEFLQSILERSHQSFTLALRLLAGLAIDLAGRTDRELERDRFVEVPADQNLGIDSLEPGVA